MTAWGYCHIHGLSPAQPLEVLLSPALLAAARSLFIARLARWTTAADSFGEQWDEAPDPAELCELMIERRTEVWAVATAFQQVGQPVDDTAFDAALRTCIESRMTNRPRNSRGRLLCSEVIVSPSTRTAKRG